LSRWQTVAGVENSVKILFIGPLKSVFGRDSVHLPVGKDETLQSILEKLVTETGRGREYLSSSRDNPENLAISVDGELVRDLSRSIRGGETILLTPALSGGSQTAVRCLNCATRIPVPPEATSVVCNQCGSRYSITWVSPIQPKIRRLE